MKNLFCIIAVHQKAPSMRFVAIISIILFFSVNLYSQESSPSPPPLESLKDSLNYYLGINLGYSLGTAPFETDPDLITMGLRGVLSGDLMIDQVKAQEIFQRLQQSMAAERNASMNAESEINLERGQAFLDENRTKPGITTTESGLQYEVIEEGDGPKPGPTSNVEVHYEGRLIDGTVFDSSYDRGESISFPLNRVIAGWTEGLQLMNAGSTYRFFIPPDLGYGSRATGSIPANSVLIFRVELLGVDE